MIFSRGVSCGDDHQFRCVLEAALLHDFLDTDVMVSIGRSDLGEDARHIVDDQAEVVEFFQLQGRVERDALSFRQHHAGAGKSHS